MSKRTDRFGKWLTESRERFAQTIASSPKTPRISLHSTEADASPFVEVAARLVTSISIQIPIFSVFAIHIDNWFGQRWLGFRGELLGAAEVRSRSLKEPLVLPPFHPHRILSARHHRFVEDGSFADIEDLGTLHVHRKSEANLNNIIRSEVIYFWYSGNTQKTQRGAAMIYYRTGNTNRAFYTMFDGRSDWRLQEYVGISRQEISDLLDISAQNCGVDIPPTCP